jgi:glutathione S-transferase
VVAGGYVEAGLQDTRYRLFSWEHSYFSGKARSYLRYKERMGDLGPGFEDILATPELMLGVLTPATGSGAVPQLLTPEGSWVQDSSEIIDAVEATHSKVPVIPSPTDAPRQAIASYLIELLADEWLVVPGFWERWHYSREGVAPSHLAWNEQQWGAVFAAGSPGPARRAAGQAVFEQMFGISHARTDPKGVYAGLVHLGVSPETEDAWWASMEGVLERLDAHFAEHDFVLGGLPSLADFGLMGPLYAHVFRDATSGFQLRNEHPLVAEWVERTNGTNSLNARSYAQRLYSLAADGQLVGRPATSDAGKWLPDDEVPSTLDAVVEVFFREMWPVMKSTLERTAAFIASDDHEPGGQLPGKTFFADPPWVEHQTGGGALTHGFAIGGLRATRMVAPIHVWMLQRVAAALEEAVATDVGRASIESWLAGFPDGPELLSLEDRLSACRVRKQGALLYSVR